MPFHLNDLDLGNTKKEKRPLKDMLPARRDTLSKPENYIPGEGLVDAVTAALLIRRPLLLTGKPGTGKTELGEYLAWKMDLDYYKFDCKSTSVGRELFYSYDAIGHYRAGAGSDPEYFITYDALGQAILGCEEGLAAKRQALVVIDEIDKAPRDFPNDLLNEVDRMRFRIPELRNRLVKASKDHSPIVVITSNSEKNLPAPFLRRCVYYDIPFPADDDLKKVVRARLQEFHGESGSALLDSAVVLFRKLFDDLEAAGGRQPGTAELLDWLLALIGRGARLDVSLREQPDLVWATRGTLVKGAEDGPAADETIQAFLGER